MTQMVKNLPAVQETRVQSLGKIPWRRKWQPTPIFLPGKVHGLRSLVDDSPWGRKESDTTEQLTYTSFPLGSETMSLEWGQWVLSGAE